MDLKYVRVPALQSRSPEFKLQSHQNNDDEKRNDIANEYFCKFSCIFQLISRNMIIAQLELISKFSNASGYKSTI
jgi:hypothetical protein